AAASRLVEYSRVLRERIAIFMTPPSVLRTAECRQQRMLASRAFPHLGSKGRFIRARHARMKGLWRARAPLADRWLAPVCQAYGQLGGKRVKGIEPSSVAWEATALPLSYTRTKPRW